MSNWSTVITQTSRSLKLEKGVFTFECPIKIAQSLKRSAINKPNPLLSA